MSVLAWIGAILGIVGGSAGLISFWLGVHDRREARGLRSRQIPRELESLEADYRNLLTLSESSERDTVNRIAADANARGMYYSSARESDQRKAREDARRERDNATRVYEQRKAALEDELEQLT